MAAVVIRADIPDELLQQFLQHVRDFDSKHAGCHFEIAATTALNMEQVLRAMQINPELPGRWSMKFTGQRKA